ncbi:hypothetical protein Goklo_000711 [Gossypium klotzschianum]|uniref:Cytochrome P450 n=2 Tax=Gossypium TaxID=3633 RepID=A0A7J8VYY8_9ROSI|nr:hypothetical protein [Gossypium klotzschianum]
MDSFIYSILIISILAFIIIRLILFFSSKSCNGVPQKRLLLGMLSLLFPNLDVSVHDRTAEMLERSKGTIHIHQYSWFTGTKVLLTSDPANVCHVLSTNFSNYPKGSKWREHVDVLGDTLFSADFKEWEKERKLVRSLTSYHKFHQATTKIVWDRIQTGLIPVLQHASKLALLVDLQDLFQKLILDIAWMISIGYNPNFLGIEFRKDPFSVALEDACEAAFSRFLMPHSLWKLHRWLGIGKEKKLKHAWETIDRVFADCISKKQEESAKGEDHQEGCNFEGVYCVTGEDKAFRSAATRKGLRDNIVSFIFATQDTTSSVLTWFFYSVAKHPSVEAKIRDEIFKNNPQALNKLVYLHAALCETLRLFPPGPVLSRIAVEPDTLPSGHRINGNTNVVIAVHAMGRMTSIWGDDCHEFKPERWITEQGEIKRVSHYQFPAFSAGPRICLGKELAFMLMKATAATIIYNYDIEIQEDHPAEPKSSVVFHMKHGLMARINSRGT